MSPRHSETAGKCAAQEESTMSDIYCAGTSGRSKRPTLADFMAVPDDRQVVLNKDGTGLKFKDPKSNPATSQPSKFQFKSRRRTGSVIVHQEKNINPFYGSNGENRNVREIFFRVLNKEYGINRLVFCFITFYELDIPLCGRDIRQIRKDSECFMESHTLANIAALLTPYYETHPPILGESYNLLQKDQSLRLHENDIDHPDLISQIRVTLNDDPQFHEFPLSLEQARTVADRTIRQFAKQGAKEEGLKFGLVSRELSWWPRELLQIIGRLLADLPRSRS